MTVVPGNMADDPRMKRVRINARLIYAGTDTQLWDRTFETVAADVFALQRQVVTAVADGIHLRLTAKPASRPGQDFEAFDLYLKGRYYWNTRTEAGLKQSIQYFQAAIDRDPGYALVYSGLADAYNVLAQYGLAPWRDTLSARRRGGDESPFARRNTRRSARVARLHPEPAPRMASRRGELQTRAHSQAGLRRRPSLVRELSHAAGTIS